MRTFVRRLCTAAIATAMFCVAVAVVIEAAGLRAGVAGDIFVDPLRSLLGRWTLLERTAAVVVASAVAVIATAIGISVLPGRRQERGGVRLPWSEGGVHPAGALVLANRASQALVTRAVLDVDGTVTCVARLNRNKRGWKVRVRAELRPGLPIPAVSKQIRSMATAALERQTGVPVARFSLWTSVDYTPARRRLK